MKSLSCVRLFCDPMDCSLPGSSVHGIFQARILEWVAMSSSRASSWSRDQTWVSRMAGRCFTVWAWPGRLHGERPPATAQSSVNKNKINIDWVLTLSGKGLSILQIRLLLSSQWPCGVKIWRQGLHWLSEWEFKHLVQITEPVCAETTMRTPSLPASQAAGYACEKATD